jgi:CHAT domain-containing protein/uncharacterized protein HemY
MRTNITFKTSFIVAILFFISALSPLSVAIQGNKHQEISVKSVDQLVTLIESALGKNDSNLLMQVKTTNLKWVGSNTRLIIEKCGSLLNKAVEEETIKEMVRANVHFRICRVLADIFYQATGSRYLLEKVVYFLKLSIEEKKTFLKATELYNKGEQHRRAYKKNEAIELYKRSLALYSKIGYPEGKARTLRSIGDVQQMTLPDKAQQFYNQSLVIYRNIQNRIGEATILRCIANVHRRRYEFKKASDLYHKALAISGELKDRQGEADSIQGLADANRIHSDYEKVYQLYEKALFIYREIKYLPGEASSLWKLGVVSRIASNYDKSLEFSEQALKIYKSLNDRLGEANTLDSLGDLHISLANYKKALNYNKSALKLYREIDAQLGVANSLQSLGRVYQNLHNYEKALECFSEVLTIFRDIKDRLGEANTLQYLGGINMALNKYVTALNCYEEALSIHREINNRLGEANILQMLGNWYRFQNVYEKAKTFYDEAFLIYQAIKHPLGIVYTLLNIGDINRALDKNERAIENYKQAVATSKKIKNRWGEADSMQRLAHSYLELDEYKKAYQYYENALFIYRECNLRLGEVVCLNGLGEVQQELSNYEQAQQHFQEALAISREINVRLWEAYSLKNLGDVNYWLKNYAEARSFFEKALKLQKQMGHQYGMLRSYYCLAGIFEKFHNYTKAEEYYRQSIRIIENVWEQMRVETFKTHYLSSKIIVYRAFVAFLFEQKKHKAALYFSERSKARSFLYILGNEKLKPHEGIPTELIKKEGKLRQKITLLTSEILKNEEKEKGRRSDSERLKSELFKLKNEHGEIIEKMKLQSSEYASLKSVNPIPIEKIQALIRQDLGTVLIEYYTTPQAIYMWLLDGKHLYSYNIDISEKNLDAGIKEFRAIIDDGSSSPLSLTTRARKLYNLLLKPVEKHIQGKKRIAIVPHGILHYLPFEALMNNGEFLIEQGFKFFYLPSASVYKYCRQKNNLKKDQLLAFGNPDGSLPYSEKEVNEIKNIVAGNAKSFIGKDATEAAIRENSGQSDLLHFACHGTFDSDHPLYSALLLSPDANDDGRLEVGEIFNLNLKPAYLVTLSACQTKLGGINRGDEIVGLSRAFIYAGTPSIVASLWKVDDQSTAQFMAIFYRALKTHDKIDALDIARKEMMSKYGKRHPCYWAAFVLIGDPR